MNERWSLWQRNVMDHFKDMPDEEIKEELQKTAHPFAVCMEQWQGDFNIGTLIRNANAFNAEKVFYIGRKRYDRRGTVGTAIQMPEGCSLTQTGHHQLGLAEPHPLCCIIHQSPLLAASFRIAALAPDPHRAVKLR